MQDRTQDVAGRGGVRGRGRPRRPRRPLHRPHRRGPGAVRPAHAARRAGRRPGHRGRGGLALPARRRRHGPRRLQGPRRGPLPVRRPRPLRRLRLAARQAGRPAPAQGRGRSPSSCSGSPGLTPEEAGWDGTVDAAPRATSCPPGEVPAWRTRVQYAVDEDGRAGLRRHRSHEVEPIDHCMIAAPGVSELGIEKRDWPQMASVEAIAATGSQRPPGHPHPAPGRPPARSSSWTSRSRSCASRRRTAASTASTAAPSSASAPTAVRTASACGGFWQVHPQAADTLVKAVMQGLLPRKGDMALDLYCGVGLFAGALADRVGEKGAVLGIESGKRAVEDARHNLAGLRPGPHRTGQGRAGPAAHRHHRGRPDRPRPAARGRGQADGRSTWRRLGARRIAYVACDPAALARDLGVLPGRAATGSRTLRAFDLFPMTHHVECVAILEPAAKGL